MRVPNAVCAGTSSAVLVVLLGLPLALLPALPAQAELAVSISDRKVKPVNGAVEVQAGAGSDTLTVFEINGTKLRPLGEVSLPTSESGTPLSVAVSPDENLALVTAAAKPDAKDGTRLVPNDVLSVVELRAGSPTVAATLQAGLGASGVAINRAGTLALVANHAEGTVSVFTISGKTVSPQGKVTVGDAQSGPSGVAITPDGARALVTLDGEAANRIAVLAIDGTRVTATQRDLVAGVGPTAVDISPDGTVAAVANRGRGSGDLDTASLVDLSLKPPRVVETFTVGQTPLALKFSPDGQWLAVTVNNGSTKPAASPFHNDYGFLILYRVVGTHATKVAQAPVAPWPHGVAFSSDNRVILVGSMGAPQVAVFNWNGRQLKNTDKPLKAKGGSAAIRTADRPFKPGN